MFNQSDIETANKTSRNSPAIGAKALTPRYVRAYIDSIDGKDDTYILDFGAGKDAAHTKALLNDGYKCTAHEFGNNVNENHNENALTYQYDVVFASNVLNVQSSEAMLRETIKQIASSTSKVLFANYPLSPRKCTLHPDEVADILSEYFTTVYFEGGKASAPVWKCEK